MKHLPYGAYYTLPYRCLVPQRTESLLVAGRPISTTHEAHSATRIQAVACATGEAAGVAAALALRAGCSPRDLDPAALQDTLRAQGAFLGD
jgi:hypothetical protein